jgi:hypothetical protein
MQVLIFLLNANTYAWRRYFKDIISAAFIFIAVMSVYSTIFEAKGLFPLASSITTMADCTSSAWLATVLITCGITSWSNTGSKAFFIRRIPKTDLGFTTTFTGKKIAFYRGRCN